MQTRIQHRFVGHNDVVYGKGTTKLEAIDDARATLGEPMSTATEMDENGYVVEVTQVQVDENGEWFDAPSEGGFMGIPVRVRPMFA
ncbi:hypothetical protein [Paraburkholderia sp. C35]|uniref:hypothetical protein n=1 Tax=Paraburkholderia sp. C35 TaxID=2126993 RepID=UPI000D686965|nr:hypothetical protein [Paraburkholderia sp. C35]